MSDTGAAIAFEERLRELRKGDVGEEEEDGEAQRERERERERGRERKEGSAERQAIKNGGEPPSIAVERRSFSLSREKRSLLPRGPR